MPDVDQIIARIQAFIRSILGGGGGGGPRSRFTGGRGLALIGIAVVALWLASGIYRVEPDEQGVVLRFGAFDRTTLPGLNYHLPWPIETALTPAVTRINRIEIGYRSVGATSGDSKQATREVPEESLMLTGDENIIDIDFAVFWKINNAVAYLFNTRNPPLIVKAVAESSMREVIGRTPIQPALTELRGQIASDVQRQTQQVLDNYKSGVEITGVQLQGVNPPSEVIESFLDVQRANTDAERLQERGRGLSQRHRAARTRRRGAYRRPGTGRETVVDCRGDRTDPTFPVRSHRISAGEGRDAAADVHRDHAGHSDAFAGIGGG